LTNNLFWSEA